MIELIAALKDSNVPTILTIAGVVLLLLAIGVEGGIKVSVESILKRQFGLSAWWINRLLSFNIGF